MVTVVYFWRIRKIGLPIAILNMASNKMMLKRIPGISFIKLLGTGKGETFKSDATSIASASKSDNWISPRILEKNSRTKYNLSSV